jgi:hypothetical protein
MADIDLSSFTGNSFHIIGNIVKTFGGVFDGNNHTISNFSYTYTDRSYTGLFGYVSGQIKDLGLINPNVDAGTGNRVGLLVGYLSNGTITNCYVKGGSVAGGGSLYDGVGGLVGTNEGTITNCHAEGGSVAGNSNVSGLVGVNSGTITNCYSSGSVSGSSVVGGLVGKNSSTITNCYSSNSVSGSSVVGGLVGYNSGKVSNSYSIAGVSGDKRVGGLVGENSYGCTITYCYSIGSVSGDERVGGLVGYNKGYVVSSYWDIETSGQAISEGGKGKTTAQMMMAGTFLHWGTCDEVWTINEGVDYPRLAWEQRPGELIVGIIPLEGDGVPNNPYLIHTPEQLNVIGLLPCVWDKHFKLMANIDLSQYTGTEFNIIVVFTGTFDGNGHTISNFSYTSISTQPIGLFGYVSGENAVIRDLAFINPNVDAGSGHYVGSLVGLLSNGNVTNCYAEGGSVAGLFAVGGLVGCNNYGTISECYSTGSISGCGYNGGPGQAWSSCIGGLVGDNEDGTITNCYSTGSVSGGLYVGGLVGDNSGTISNSYAKGGSVSGSDRVGGLVGRNDGTITNCRSTGGVSGHYGIGGLVGINRGTITNCDSSSGVSGFRGIGGLTGNNQGGTISSCYSNGDVEGEDEVGGLVGYNEESTITNCYAAGRVSGTRYVGGLVGRNYSGIINNCYSTGSVSGDEYVGGLVGSGRWGYVSGSYWEIESSGQSTSTGGMGKTTSEMQTASTFVGFGCEPVWTIDEGKDYPRLVWENKPGKIITKMSYGGGSGESNDPYLIYTAEHLNMIGWILCDLDKHFKLMADIDLSSFTGTSFNIIGYYVSSSNNKPFTGVFDGSDHAISNFTYASTDTHRIGLFGYVSGENAEIRNLGLIDPDVDGGTRDYVGSLVGRLWGGTITNCYIHGGSVSGDSRVGGLVGYNVWGTIANCYSTGSVSGNEDIGGLVGINHGTITDCYSTGSVTGMGVYVGGLAGRNSSTITNCYSSGSVSGDAYVGGLVGRNSSTITNCYSSGSVWGNKYIGGLVGYNEESTITNCYAAGRVSGTRYVGGLVGLNRGWCSGGTPPRCYYGTIINCYSTCSVSGVDSVGGLVGRNWVGEVTNSFWDIETSGQATSDGGTGLPTAEMQIQSTFINAGWDFVGETFNGIEDIWFIPQQDYPHLWW